MIVEKHCRHCRVKTSHDKDGTCVQCVKRNQWVNGTMSWFGDWLDPYTAESKDGKRNIRNN